MYVAALVLSALAVYVGLRIGLGTLNETCADDTRWGCSDTAEIVAGVLLWGGAIAFLGLVGLGAYRLVRSERNHSSARSSGTNGKNDVER